MAVTSPDPLGREHAVLSDGWRRIRIDVEQGSLTTGAAVLLHYRKLGLASAEPMIQPLRRFLVLCRHGRFARSMFPRDPRVGHKIAKLGLLAASERLQTTLNGGFDAASRPTRRAPPAAAVAATHSCGME